MDKSLYVRLGGNDAVESVVEDLYTRVLEDDRIAYLFKDTDVEGLIQHQHVFLIAAFGGPNNFEGRPMKKAHAHLAITDKEFDAVVGHLKDALQDLNISNDLISEVMAILEPMRSDIVNR